VPAIHDFWLFVLSGILLNITPGPDTLYILGRTVAQGRRAGFLSVLGISSGILIHTAAAALGLSAILASSATAFTFLRYAGALYLVYLGLRLLLTAPEHRPASARRATPVPLLGHLPPRSPDQRPEPQGRHLLPRLPPPVR
jgi:threonine/homoserine/homoserine lactone efflux protein